MTDIITFDVKKPIENSINELVKNLSNDIEKKIREDITNNILMNITTKSIYGLDDIKDFGKLCGITNVIDGLLLNNDDILFLILILISIKMSTCTGYSTTNKYSDIVIPLLIKNNFINDGEHGDKKLDNSLRRYFASVHDNKIKAFEFDKLLKNYKELEISINNNKIELDEAKYKYKILNDENGMYKDEIKELIKLIKNTELEINKQKEIIIDLEENIKLSDEWLILKDITIKKFEEDNYKLRMEKDRLIKNNNELKKELGKILKENNNLIEENKNVNSKIIELIEDMKNMSNENNKKILIQ